MTDNQSTNNHRHLCYHSDEIDGLTLTFYVIIKKCKQYKLILIIIRPNIELALINTVCMVLRNSF